MKRIFIFGLISCVVLVFLSGYHLVRFSDKKLHLIFCNVGQGDGIFIRSANGDDIIIDGGIDGNLMKECLTRHMPFFDRTIDAIFLTHPDADHLTGLISVIESYSVKFFGTSQAPKDTEIYQELKKVLAAKKIPIQYLFRGDAFQLKDSFSIFIHWPTPEFINQKSEESNDYSLVQEIVYGHFRTVLTGDVPSVYLNSIMPALHPIHVFKPPHHGSKTGIDLFTFQHNVPKFAVLSFGKANRYHHPSSEVIDLLEEFGVPYTNTLKGDVEIISDGTKWWVQK